MKKRIKHGKVYNNDWPIVAICYDFDKTLSPKDMQDFGLIPKLKCQVNDFWKESNGIAEKNGMDRILSYMLLIIEKASQQKVTVTKRDFNNLGKGIKLFPGVETWFDRINNYASEIGINLEHYIISAGLKEIIQGTSIARNFAGIYASSFIYSEYGAPIWPCQVVNYTTKTQHLFRISKDCLDLSDESSINEYIEREERRIPFRNFIYIGDSETDIPAMKIVKNGGGTSIGVYNSETVNLSRVSKLLKQDRINYLVPAIYEEDSRLDNLVKDTLNKIKAQESLHKLNKQQNDYVDRILDLESFVDYTETFLQKDYDLADLQNFQTQARQLMKQAKKMLVDEFSEMVSEDEIAKIIDEKNTQLMELFKKKKLIVKNNIKLINANKKTE